MYVSSVLFWALIKVTCVKSKTSITRNLELLRTKRKLDTADLVAIIIIYIYHALINALSVHMIHINLNTIFYRHIEHSPTKTIYIRYYI